MTTLGSNLFGPTNAPPNLTNITAIAAGALHSLALRADGTVVAWGYSPSDKTATNSEACATYLKNNTEAASRY